MGRTAGQYCSRASMYPPSPEALMPDSIPLVAVEEEAPENIMTWQQKKDFGPALAKERKSRQVRWQPLDLEAIHPMLGASAAGNERSWSEQQGEVPIVSLPRAEAAASPLSVSPSPASTKPATRNSLHHTAPNSQKKPRRRSNRNKNNLESKQDMLVLPESAYVPPHLRNRNRAAPITATGKTATNPATNGSSTISPNSKLGHNGKAQSSPNGTSRMSHQTPSLATTPQEPQLPMLQAQVDVGKGLSATNTAKVDTPLPTAEPDGNGWLGWDTPVPEPPPAAPKKGNPRWPRMKGPPKKTVWPKSRDMKPMPSDSSSDGGISFKSNSNGDPHHDVKKLVDWNGDWLPPPVEWSARKGHTDRHFGRTIEQWIDGHPQLCTDKVPIDLTALSDDKDCKEIVPRYWVLSTVEQGSLGDFWKSMPLRQPSALSDVSVLPPFWERYEQEPSYFIEGLVVPDACVDPSDLENHYAGVNLMACAEERVATIMQHRLHSQRRSLAKQKRPVPESVPAAPQLPDRRIFPKSNVYFRPVQPGDEKDIAVIYNDYVENTIFAPEFDSRTEHQILNRINTIVKAGLPYLVAIARRNQRKGPNQGFKERVVGYASLDDYCDQSSIYRYTFELELYVHQGFTSQNIASCLLDRLLEMASTGYNACGGYEYQNNSNYLKTGPGRVIKTIVATMQKEHGESEDKTTDYMKRFKFVRAGHIPQMGFKLGKTVDVFLYRHTTSETIDPNGRPTVPLERD